MDWNEDGKKDLITGESSGDVRIYLNTNTDADPVFTGFEYLELAGIPYHGGFIYSMPCVVDWNNDGRKDMLCGNLSGRVHLLLNEGTNALPLFNEAVYLKDGSLGSELTVTSHASPAVADLNLDGKKDLLAGGYYGTIWYFENKGSDADPYFDGGAELEAGGVLVDVGQYSRIDVTDWNGDGVPDILCGYENTAPPWSGVWFFEHVGPLWLDTNAVSAGSGGSVAVSLNAGAAHAGRTYYILGSVTGTEPGTPLPGGGVLPINWDPFTDIGVALLNTSIFSGFAGSLDAEGKAAATLNAPPVPSAVGVLMSYAYALNNPWDYASNGAGIELVP